jgi:hypothetical protein
MALAHLLVQATQQIRQMLTDLLRGKLTRRQPVLLA